MAKVVGEFAGGMWGFAARDHLWEEWLVQGRCWAKAVLLKEGIGLRNPPQDPKLGDIWALAGASRRHPSWRRRVVKAALSALVVDEAQAVRGVSSQWASSVVAHGDELPFG